MSPAERADLIALIAVAVREALAARTPLRPIAVSIPDAARLLSFSENHFRSYIMPDLPVIRGSRPRILVADVERWAETHREQPASALFAPRRPSAELSPEVAARAQRRLERANRSPEVAVRARELEMRAERSKRGAQAAERAALATELEKANRPPRKPGK